MEESKKEDLTPLVDAAIAEGSAKLRAGDLAGAVERVLSTEKRTRMASDAPSTSRLCTHIIRLCWEAKDLRALNSNVLVIAKRRGQLKQAITDVVTEAMTYIDSISNVDDRVELIKTLRAVTEGKIYVEVERARLTRTLAGILESQGAIAAASETLQEITIETYGSLDAREKGSFLLEQVRLTHAQGDYVRMGIIANKVNVRVLDGPGMEDLRVKYFELRIALDGHRRDAYALCKDYHAVMATRGFAEDAEKWMPALQSCIVFLALSPFNHEVSDFLHRVKTDKRTEELPAYRALLNYLTTDELIPWPLPAPHHDILRAHPAFAQPAPSSTAAAASSGSAFRIPSTIVRKEDEARVTWWDVFHKRIVQHNVRVIGKWYSRLPSTRLAELLGLDANTTEAVISELIADKTMYGRIDRPAGVVVFARPQAAAGVLTEWTSDMDAVLSLVEKTAHLIQKEYMVHGLTQKL